MDKVVRPPVGNISQLRLFWYGKISRAIELVAAFKNALANSLSSVSHFTGISSICSILLVKKTSHLYLGVR
eukprot:9483085-Prorocentrum_lima.AAC.1